MSALCFFAFQRHFLVENLQQCLTENPKSAASALLLGETAAGPEHGWLIFWVRSGCVVMGLSQIWPSNLFSPSLPQIPIIRRCDRNLCLPLCLRGKKGNIVSFFESWFLEHDEVELWWPPTSFFPMFFWDPFLYNILILDADRSLCLPP